MGIRFNKVISDKSERNTHVTQVTLNKLVTTNTVANTANTVGNVQANTHYMSDSE